MLVFSAFVASKHCKLTPKNFEGMLTKWLNELKYYHLTQDNRLLPAETYQALFEKFYSIIEAHQPKLIQQAAIDGHFPVIINKLDRLATVFKNRVLAQIDDYFQPSVPNNDIETNKSGVSIKAYLQKDEFNFIEIGEQVQSDVGSIYSKKAKKSLNDAIESPNYPLLQSFENSLKNLMNKHKSPKKHGEENWFDRYFIVLLETLIANHQLLSITEQQKWQFDQDPSLFFIHQGPKINFFLKSTPCGSCIELFCFLRDCLEKLNLPFPIFIYAYKPTNTAQAKNPTLSIVNFSGQVITTNCSETDKKHALPPSVQDFNDIATISDLILCLFETHNAYQQKKFLSSTLPNLIQEITELKDYTFMYNFLISIRNMIKEDKKNNEHMTAYEQCVAKLNAKTAVVNEDNLDTAQIPQLLLQALQNPGPAQEHCKHRFFDMHSIESGKQKKLIRQT